MALTFSKGSTVILHNGTTSRKLLVESITASQTFLEDSRGVKTIQVPNNVQDTSSNSKSTVSLELSCHLTTSDGMLLEWFGFVKSGNKFLIQPAGTLVPVYTVYIVSGATVYQITNAYATTLSFKLDKERPLSISISATGNNLTQIMSAPTPNSTQVSTDFIYGSLDVVGYSNVAGATCEISKTISWLNDKTIHAIMAGFYYSNKAVCDELAIGGSLTFYKRDSTLSYAKEATVEIRYSDIFRLSFDKCKLLDRWDLGSDVHKKITDYKLQPTSGDAHILNGSASPSFLEFILDGQGF